MSTLEPKLILTPGAKRRLLHEISLLIRAIKVDADRDTIMLYASTVLPLAINPFAYYDKKQWEKSLLKKLKRVGANRD